MFLQRIINFCRTRSPLVVRTAKQAAASFETSTIPLQLPVFDDTATIIDPGYRALKDGKSIPVLSVKELKESLDLRGIDYSDCLDKESLQKRLAGCLEPTNTS